MVGCFLPMSVHEPTKYCLSKTTFLFLSKELQQRPLPHSVAAFQWQEVIIIIIMSAVQFNSCEIVHGDFCMIVKQNKISVLLCQVRIGGSVFPPIFTIAIRNIWHRRKLPFEILNFAKFCYKKLPNLPHFAIKNCQTLQIKFSFQSLFWSRRPRILNRSKDAHRND